MSTGGAPLDVGSLTKKTEQIQNDTASVIAAIGRAKRIRICLTIVALILVAGIVWSFLSIGLQYTKPDTQLEFSNLATERLTANADEYSGEVQKLIDNAAPTLQKALMTQVNEDMDTYKAALTEQRELLVKNLEGKLRDKIEERHKKLMADYQKILESEFPAAKDKKLRDRMVENFESALESLIEKYYITQFRESLEGMYEIWDGFPIADPAEKSELPLEDELYGNLLELLTVKLTAQQEVEGDDKARVLK